MKKHILTTTALLFAAFVSAQNVPTAEIQKEVDAHLQNLPFASFSIKVPSFGAKVYNIKDAGAVGDGVTVNTEAINGTIKKCSEAGGGTVLVPAGLWKTGPITMMSNVNLHLQAGAMVVFSADPKDNPIVNTGKELKVMPLINGTGLKNIAITGKGIFNGNGSEWRPIKREKLPEKQWKNITKKGELSPDGKIWYPVKGTMAALENLKNADIKTLDKSQFEAYRPGLKRPYLINIEKTEGMLVEGVTFMNSPHITNMLRNIDGLVMKDVKVLNEWWFQNADGLDISVCRNVLMYDCTVNTGDDGICMKSSKSSASGRQFGLENIVIKDCKVYHAHGGFVIGSNTDGGMNNILVQNCDFSWSDVGLRVKSGAGRGGRVQNIYIQDIYMKDLSGNAVEFELTYKDAAVEGTAVDKKLDLVPDFDSFFFKNIYCDGAKGAIVIGGTADLNVKNVTFDNVHIKANSGVTTFRSENITFNNVTIDTPVSPTFSLNKSVNIAFKNIDKAPASGVYAKILNPETKNITFENVKIDKNKVEILNGAETSQVKFK